MRTASAGTGRWPGRTRGDDLVSNVRPLDESPTVLPGSEVLIAVEVISPGSGSERTDRIRKVMECVPLGTGQYWLLEHTRM